MADVRVHRKVKKLTCGHAQEFISPIPGYGEWVWCKTCDNSVQMPPRPGLRVHDGRKRRLVDKPKSNNQYTKGRQLHTPTRRRQNNVDSR